MPYRGSRRAIARVVKSMLPADKNYIDVSQINVAGGTTVQSVLVQSFASANQGNSEHVDVGAAVKALYFDVSIMADAPANDPDGYVQAYVVVRRITNATSGVRSPLTVFANNQSGHEGDIFFAGIALLSAPRVTALAPGGKTVYHLSGWVKVPPKHQVFSSDGDGIVLEFHPTLGAASMVGTCIYKHR